MAVEGVNNNNAALYAGAGAAVAGGAIGGTTGYLTKSFLKDGEPTDEFVKKVMKNMSDGLSDFASPLKDAGEALKAAKTADEYKKIVIGSYDELFKTVGLDYAKEGVLASSQGFAEAGLKGISVDAIAKATSTEELLDLCSKNFDENFAGKSVKEITETYDKISFNKTKNILKQGLEIIYDSDKKKFINLDSLGDSPLEQIAKKTGQAMKDAASSIKWKAAGIYGGIAAALLGIGTYLGVANGMKSQAPEAAAEEQVAEPQQTEA